MSLSTTALLARLARRVGDASATTTGSVWDSTDLTQALTEAVEEAWDTFFVTTYDFTSLAGSVNSIAADTAEISVPSSFIATTSTTAVAAPGLISAIEVRETGTLSYTEPLAERWFFVEDGVRIDNLALTTPKIRFANPFNVITEIRLYGGMPIVLPASAGTAVPGTDNAGFVSWLMATAASKLYEMRVTSDPEDQTGLFQTDDIR
jgi:hypothetical protein